MRASRRRIRLTDGQGRTVDFRNTILILTANLGSSFIADPSIDPEHKRDAVMAVVRDHFKPEFLNRLDDVVIFDSLSTEDLTHIVDLQIDLLARRVGQRRIVLQVTPAAREWLALTGFDPVYGARPDSDGPGHPAPVDHDVWSAGINRHGEGDESALHRRASDPRWPRVMRWRL